MAQARPIIVIKKKAGHAGHHGGAWKVAYADFVTAMMALFIVLWLLNTSKQTQEAIGGYFRDPTGTSKKVGTNLAGAGENFAITKNNMPKLKEQLQKAMKQLSNFDELGDQIEMTVTSEGLRIELMESASGTFFDSGSSIPSENGVELMSLLAAELESCLTKCRLKDTPTQSHMLGSATTELGTLVRPRQCCPAPDAKRGARPRSGLPGSRIRRPAPAHSRRNPLESSNRRISLIVQYLAKDDDESGAGKPESGTPGGASRLANRRTPVAGHARLLPGIDAGKGILRKGTTPLLPRNSARVPGARRLRCAFRLERVRQIRNLHVSICQTTRRREQRRTQHGNTQFPLRR